MLDIKLLRTNPERIQDALKKRNNDLDIAPAIELDKQRRALLADVEQRKAEQNEITKKNPAMKKAGEDTDAIFAEMRALSDTIKEDDAKIAQIDSDLRNFMLRIPNIPHESVPVGADDSENVEIRRYGEPTAFSFEPKAHWDIGTDLNILDFDRGAKNCRLPVHGVPGAGRKAGAGGHPILSGYPHRTVGLHRDPAAVHGQPGLHDGHGPAPEI